MVSKNRLLPRTVHPLPFSDSEKPLLLCGLVTPAQIKRRDGEYSYIVSGVERSSGPRLLPLSTGSSRRPKVSDNPYCSQRRLFDRYIWLRAVVSLGRDGISQFRRLANASSNYTGIIVNLEMLTEVFVVDESDSPQELSADNFWGVSTQNKGVTPVHYQRMLKRASTLRSVANTDVLKYSSPVVLLHRDLKKEEITAII